MKISLILLTICCFGMTSCSLFFFMYTQIERIDYASFDFEYKNTGWTYIGIYGYMDVGAGFDANSEFIIANDKLYTYKFGGQSPDMFFVTDDGFHYTGENTDFPSWNRFHQIIFFNNKFWFFTDYTIYISDDMLNWSVLNTLPLADTDDDTWGNQYYFTQFNDKLWYIEFFFYMDGWNIIPEVKIRSTTNGVDWSDAFPAPPWLGSYVFSDFALEDYLYLCFNDTVYETTDFISWRLVTSNPSWDYENDILNKPAINILFAADVFYEFWEEEIAEMSTYNLAGSSSEAFSFSTDDAHFLFYDLVYYNNRLIGLSTVGIMLSPEIVLPDSE